MSLVVQIGLALALLAGVIAPWISNKTWHWSLVLLLNCIVLAGGGFLFLAAETVRTHHVLRKDIPRLENQLQTTKQQNETLLHGSGNTEGVLDLEHQLQMVSRNRGRVWRNVMPASVVDEQGKINVDIAQPKPHGLTEGSIVFAFESAGSGQPAASSDASFDDDAMDETPVDDTADDAPVDGAPAEEETEGSAEAPAAANTTARKQYLGEFRVTAVSESGVSLESVQLMNPRTSQRLIASQGPWSLYETMPVDRHSVLAGVSEEELQQLMPEESIDEYLRHGTPATDDDNEFNKIGLDENDQRVANDQAVKFLYDRPLRDYAFLFADFAQKRVLLEARIQAVTEDNAKLTESIESATRLGEFREQQKKLLKVDLTGMQTDRQAIEAHRDQLQKMVANAKTQINGHLDENSQMARLLTEKQFNQIQLINSTAPAPAGAETSTP